MPVVPDPPERAALEPFASIFVEIVIPEAAAGGWFEAMQEVPTEEVARVSRRIAEAVAIAIGKELPPFVYVHALLVCGHMYYASAEECDLSTCDDPLPRVDAAFSLVRSLVLHHNLFERYLACSM